MSSPYIRLPLIVLGTGENPASDNKHTFFSTPFQMPFFRYQVGESEKNNT